MLSRRLIPNRGRSIYFSRRHLVQIQYTSGHPSLCVRSAGLFYSDKCTYQDAYLMCGLHHELRLYEAIRVCRVYNCCSRLYPFLTSVLKYYHFFLPDKTRKTRGEFLIVKVRYQNPNLHASADGAGFRFQSFLFHNSSGCISCLQRFIMRANVG